MKLQELLSRNPHLTVSGFLARYKGKKGVIFLTLEEEGVRIPLDITEYLNYEVMDVVQEDDCYEVWIMKA